VGLHVRVMREDDPQFGKAPALLDNIGNAAEQNQKILLGTRKTGVWIQELARKMKDLREIEVQITLNLTNGDLGTTIEDVERMHRETLATACQELGRKLGPKSTLSVNLNFRQFPKVSDAAAYPRKGFPSDDPYTWLRWCAARAELEDVPDSEKRARKLFGIRNFKFEECNDSTFKGRRVLRFISDAAQMITWVRDRPSLCII
jgi:hypothetical protein